MKIPTILISLTLGSTVAMTFDWQNFNSDGSLTNKELKNCRPKRTFVGSRGNAIKMGKQSCGRATDDFRIAQVRFRSCIGSCSACNF
jgi:hypothetical protein